MKIELLYFDGCPGYEELQPRLNELLTERGLLGDLESVPVTTPEQAERERFLGSPTLRVDGHDVEPGADQRRGYGMNCRLYETGADSAHAPSNDLIVAALDRSANRSVSAVDLYWLPLGAGGRFVRLNGRIYEAIAARMAGRKPLDLYHSALQVELPEGRFVIEQAPVRDHDGYRRGVVAEGPVGSRLAGRLRIFRYEVRCWSSGSIPDLDEAVGSPLTLTADEDIARRMLDLVAEVPTPVWGRDELKAGEMWNSNSIIAWVLARSGIETDRIHPPAGGRAPGWQAGLTVAARPSGTRPG
ncbi:MAG: hypothetical protein M9938_09290 [Solirubrobacterales bacterium]|nr:hypothetical protein [Solirubrobacterales bacterium]